MDNIQETVEKINAEMEKRFASQNGAAEPAQPTAPTEPAPVEPTAVEATVEPAPAQGEQYDFIAGEPASPQVDYGLLEKRLKQLEEENNSLKQTNPFADERIAKINEYVKNGGEINETFWKLQSKNYSNIDFSNENSLISAIKDKYTLVDGFTDKEAERLIQKNFPNVLDRENADPDELIDEVISLKSATKDALPKLQELQKKAALPEVSREQVEANQRAVEAYRVHALTTLKDIKSFEIPLSDEYTFKVGVDQNNYERLKDLIANPEKQETYFVDNYRDNEGKVNFKQFAEDEYFRVNRVPILKAAFAKGLERGKAQAIQTELLNERPESGNKRSAGGAAEPWMLANAETLKKLK
jgi:hypothetical protein